MPNLSALPQYEQSSSQTLPSVLKAVGLTKRYRDCLALDNLSLNVQRRQILCLLGANGAGKTTTLNIFLGFTRADEGVATVCDVNVAEQPERARSMLGYVAEVVSLYPSLSGAENLEFFHELTGKPKLSIETRDAILRQLRFPEGSINKRVGEYSKGMRQKIGLAIALAKGAEGILLDEPLSGLDPASANDLVAVLKQVAAAGSSLLVSTHDIFRAAELASQIGIMRHGRLLEWLDPGTLTARELEAIYLRHMAERVI